MRDEPTTASRSIVPVAVAAVAIAGMAYLLSTDDAAGGTSIARPATPAEREQATVLRDETTADSSIRERVEATPVTPTGLRLRLQVVDTTGRPRPGVRVCLRAAVAPFARLWAGTTRGALGVAELPPPGKLPTRVRDAAGTLAAIDIPADHLERVAVDPRHPPAEPVRLVLPGTGSLRVEVVHPDGRPWSWLPVDVVVQPVRSGEARSEDFRHTRRTVGGVAVFRHVGLGLMLTVQGRPTAAVAFVTKTVAGPTVDGATTEVRLTEDASVPILVARILDGRDDQPVRSARLYGTLMRRYVSVSGHSIKSSSMPLRTNDEGFVRRRLGLRVRDKETRQLVVHKRVDNGDHVGYIDLSDNLPPGENVFPDVVLGRVPLLVRGTVVDDRGKGVADATVAIEADFGKPGKSQWLGLDELRVRSGADGSFELRGNPRETHLRATASKHGYFTGEAVGLSRGESGLRLVVHAGGAIAGSVRLGDVPRDSVLLALLPRTEQAAPRRPVHARPDADGKFRFEGLPRGAYDFTLRFIGSAGPVVMVAGLNVQAAETNRDPRLQEMALPPSCHVVTLHVLDSSRKPPDRAWVEVIPKAERDKRELYDVPGGTVRFAVDGDADAVVYALGHLPQRIAYVRGERQVVLRSGFTATIRLGGKFRALPPPYFLRPSLIRIAPKPRLSRYAVYLNGHAHQTGSGGMDWVWRDKVRFGRNNEAVVRLATPGKYLVLLELVAGEGGDVRRVDVRSGRLTVAEDRLHDTCTLEIDDAALAKARQRK